MVEASANSVLEKMKISSGASNSNPTQMGIPNMIMKLNDLLSSGCNESKSPRLNNFEMRGIRTVAAEIITGIEIFVNLIDAE